MAIALVQQLTASPTTFAAAGTSRAYVTTNAVSAGNYIVGFVACRNTNPSVATSVSGGGLTWTVDITSSGGAQAVGSSIFSAQAPSGLAGSTTITVTLDLTCTRSVVSLFEYSGVAASTPVGVSAAGTATTGNPSVTLGSAATANDLVFGGFSHNATGTTDGATTSGIFTVECNATAGASAFCQGVAIDGIDTTGVADVVTYTVTVDTTTAWAASACCYHAAATSTATPSVAGLTVMQGVKRAAVY